jgi:hypothetical protein
MRRFAPLPVLFVMLATAGCSGGGGVSSLAPQPAAPRSLSAESNSAPTWCPDPNTGMSNETWTLSGSALTIPLPVYGGWSGTIAFPATSPSSIGVSETDDQSNFNFAPTSSKSDRDYARRAKDFFMTFRFTPSGANGATLTDGAKTLLPITLVSPCLTSGTTYYIDAFADSKFMYSESAVASTGSVTVNVEVKPNPFPAGIYINAILSH